MWQRCKGPSWTTSLYFYYFCGGVGLYIIFKKNLAFKSFQILLHCSKNTIVRQKQKPAQSKIQDSRHVFFSEERLRLAMTCQGEAGFQRNPASWLADNSSLTLPDSSCELHNKEYHVGRMLLSVLKTNCWACDLYQPVFCTLPLIRENSYVNGHRFRYTLNRITERNLLRIRREFGSACCRVVYIWPWVVYIC